MKIPFTITITSTTTKHKVMLTRNASDQFEENYKSLWEIEFFKRLNRESCHITDEEN